MPGGNRAFTLQDVIGQLNDQSAGSTAEDAAVQINQLAVATDGVVVSDSVTGATGATSFDWDASGAYWGKLPWQ